VKGQYTTPQLKKLLAEGETLKPVFGAPLGLNVIEHAPRHKFDPQPWTDGFYRWSGWELETEQDDKEREARASARQAGGAG